MYIHTLLLLLLITPLSKDIVYGRSTGIHGFLNYLLRLFNRRVPLRLMLIYI